MKSDRFFSSSYDRNYHTHANVFRNSYQDLDTLNDDTPEYPFNQVVIFDEILTCMVLTFFIFFLILELLEASNRFSEETKSFTDIVETCYLFIVFIFIVNHLSTFRKNRNHFDPVPFENFPILIIQVGFVFVEIGYYSLSLISIFFTKIDSKRICCVIAEMMIMIIILPFALVCIFNTVRNDKKYLKIQAKFTILVSIVACLIIFTRKLAIKIREDYTVSSIANITQDYSKNNDTSILYKITKSISGPLEVIDINFFVLAFVFLIYPFYKIDYGQEPSDKVQEENIPVINEKSFSLLKWISLVRFRILSVSLSFGMISILSIALYLCQNIIFNTNLTESTRLTMFNVFLSLLTCSYIILCFYGTFYYFIDIKTWYLNLDQELKFDQYFSYLTSTAHLILSLTLLINVIRIKNTPEITQKNIFTYQLINYIFLSIQVIIQAQCINSASRRIIKIYSEDEVNSWKFNLIPPLVFTAFNFISIIISIAIYQNPEYITLFHEFDDKNIFWILLKNTTLPMIILNRYHAMTFFMNLTIKQWQ